MARTAKADTIGALKSDLIRQIDHIRLEIKAASNTVPQHVLDGDAVIAEEWRSRAEQGYFTPYQKIANKRKTVEELTEILAGEQRLMASLKEPPPRQIPVIVQSNNLDLFAA
jgi:nitroimidazol reductase NimA-like FMN-containing flavoprotein (pyridoxamine 5'-phosphate oxidase superfamily)